MNPSVPESELDRLIEPEIHGDRFYRTIARIARTEGLAHILEIGSSSGEGSTRAFVEGALENPSRPTLHCLEVSRVRFEALRRRYAEHAFVRCYNLSSVPLEAFPGEDEIRKFYRTVRSRLRRTPLPEVLRWLRQDIEYLERHGLSGWGIRRIRERHGIERFGAVLIDGSEFTGPVELEEVYGARFLLLDDIRTYKNHGNYQRLKGDPCYRLVRSSRWLRNGFAVFEREDRGEEASDPGISAGGGP